MNSQHLQDLVEGEFIPQWVADRLDRLGSEELKAQAAEQLKPTIEEAVNALCDRLEHPGEATGSMKRPPAIVNKVERYISWDLVMEWENWLSVEMPPYRWVRRVFSLACGFFSVQKVFAFLVSAAMLYGAYRGVKWVIHPASPPALSPGERVPVRAGEAAVPAVPFQITSAQYVEGNKLELHWTSVGEGYTYRVFATCDADAGNHATAVTDRAVSTAGARVNMYYDANCPTPDVQVMALTPTGASGPMSNPVAFHLSVLNNAQTVEPLAMEAEHPEAVNGNGGQREQRLTEGAVSGSLSKKKPHHSLPVPLTDASVNRPTRQPPPPAVQNPPAPPMSYSTLFHDLIKGAGNAINSMTVPVGKQWASATAKAALTAADNTGPDVSSGTPVAVPKKPKPPRADLGEGTGG